MFIQLNTYPAAIPILSTTRCQYSVATPIKDPHTENNITATAKSFGLGTLSAKYPIIIPDVVKTTTKTGPARI